MVINSLNIIRWETWRWSRTSNCPYISQSSHFSYKLLTSKLQNTNLCCASHKWDKIFRNGLQQMVQLITTIQINSTWSYKECFIQNKMRTLPRNGLKELWTTNLNTDKMSVQMSRSSNQIAIRMFIEKNVYWDSTIHKKSKQNAIWSNSDYFNKVHF